MNKYTHITKKKLFNVIHCDFSKKECVSSIITALSVPTGIIKHLFFISLRCTEKHSEMVKSIINEPITEESMRGVI